MSVVYCDGCNKHIGTDFNAEHFIEGKETCEDMGRYTIHRFKDEYIVCTEDTLVSIDSNGLVYGAEEKPDDWEPALDEVSIDDIPKHVAGEILKITHWRKKL